MTLGDQPAFPDSNLTTKPGMTYRMWLVWQIAGGLAARDGNNFPLSVEQSVDVAIDRADAIIKRLEEEGK